MRGGEGGAGRGGITPLTNYGARVFINKVAGQGWQRYLKRDPGTGVS